MIRHSSHFSHYCPARWESQVEGTMSYPQKGDEFKARAARVSKYKTEWERSQRWVSTCQPARTLKTQPHLSFLPMAQLDCRWSHL